MLHDARPVPSPRLVWLATALLAASPGCGGGGDDDGAAAIDGGGGGDGGLVDGGASSPDAACPPDTECVRCTEGCAVDDFCFEGWCVPGAQGGLLAWATPADTTGNDFLYQVATFGDGGAIAVGSAFEGAGTIGPDEIPMTNQNDAIAIRVDASGAIDWARRVAVGDGWQVAQAVVTLGDGGYVIGGYGEQTATFAPGATGETAKASNGAQDAFLARFTADGGLVWVRTWGAGGFDLVSELARAGDSIVVAGQVDGAVVFGDGEATETTNPGGGPTGFVAHFDLATGAFERAAFFASTEGCYTGGLAALADGSFAVSGVFFGTLALSADRELTAFAMGDGFVARYDAGGELVWAEQLIGAGSDVFSRVAMGPDGTVYAAGNFEGTLYLGQGDDTQELVSNGDWDFVLARFRPDGGLDWAATGGGLGPEEGPAVAIYPDGSALVATSYLPPTGALINPYAMTIAEGTADEQVLTGSLLGGTFAARYQPDGTLAWVRHFHGAPDGLASIQAPTAALGPDRSVTLVGEFGGAITFGAGEASEVTHTASGGDTELVFVRLGI